MVVVVAEEVSFNEVLCTQIYHIHKRCKIMLGGGVGVEMKENSLNKCYQRIQQYLQPRQHGPLTKNLNPPKNYVSEGIS